MTKRILAGCPAAERIGGTAAPAFLYRLPERRLRGLGAVLVGTPPTSALAVDVLRAFALRREVGYREHDSM